MAEPPRPFTRRGFLALGGAAAFLPGVAAAQSADEAEPRALARNTSRWDFLRGSFWYVPAPNLRAYVYATKSQKITYVSDQTVFQITDYRRGYFWGRSGTQLSGGTIGYRAIVGSVTPEGAIYLTFTPFGAGPTSIITIGLGQMEKRLGQWTMANQMSSGPGVPFAIYHWAYMVRTFPGRRSWNSLPGSGLSVQDFMADCPPAPELTRSEA
jgi:hypothetical protein